MDFLQTCGYHCSGYCCRNSHARSMPGLRRMCASEDGVFRPDCWSKSADCADRRLWLFYNLCVKNAISWALTTKLIVVSKKELQGSKRTGVKAELVEDATTSNSNVWTASRGKGQASSPKGYDGYLDCAYPFNGSQSPNTKVPAFVPTGRFILLGELCVCEDSSVWTWQDSLSTWMSPG